MNGITGQKVTGPNGNSIFLPAAGYASDEHIGNGGVVGYLWSSSLYTVGAPSYSYQIYYNAYKAYRRDEKRCYGLTIRPVCDK